MPIDPDFKDKLKVTGEHSGHKVWGEVKPPERLGIHGSIVCVDWDLCSADGICLEVCPVSLFEWTDSPGHPKSEKKSDPAREKDCIQCMACESQCPEQAIKIFEPE